MLAAKLVLDWHIDYETRRVAANNGGYSDAITQERRTQIWRTSCIRFFPRAHKADNLGAAESAAGLLLAAPPKSQNFSKTCLKTDV
jgi:hypothetical protein